jgi:hypothetical protein
MDLQVVPVGTVMVVAQVATQEQVAQVVQQPQRLVPQERAVVAVVAVTQVPMEVVVVELVFMGQALTARVVVP